jgi:hypothetical protein
MSLITAHRILISCAIALFVGYAVWEVTHASPDSTIRSAAALAAAVGFGLYLRTVKRR